MGKFKRPTSCGNWRKARIGRRIPTDTPSLDKILSHKQSLYILTYQVAFAYSRSLLKYTSACETKFTILTKKAVSLSPVKHMCSHKRSYKLDINSFAENKQSTGFTDGPHRSIGNSFSCITFYSTEKHSRPWQFFFTKSENVCQKSVWIFCKNFIWEMLILTAERLLPGSLQTET